MVWHIYTSISLTTSRAKSNQYASLSDNEKLTLTDKYTLGQKNTRKNNTSTHPYHIQSHTPVGRHDD